MGRATSAGKVTIWSPIYRSPEYAEFIRRSVATHTPEEHEFWFIAIDPETAVLEFLQHEKQPWLLQCSEFNAEDPLDYLKRVYGAINLCVAESETDVVVVVQSDNFVSPGWLTGLLEHLTPQTIVTPTLIERGTVESDEHVGNGGIVGMPNGDFGTPLTCFRESEWVDFALKAAGAGVYENPGPYMPFAVYRQTFLAHGGFPLGNVDGVPADKIFFDRLSESGVRHLVSRSSVVYHVGEGEKRAA